MKPIFPLAVCLWITTAAPLQAQTNRYDLVGKVLTPLASIFDPKAENRALHGQFVLESMSGANPEWIGAKLEVALAPPQRFLLRATKGEQAFTLCRSGDEIWFAPASLVKEEGLASTSSKEEKEKASTPIALPFPPQNVQFLPALFEIEDLGADGGLRRLRLRFMPILAQKLKLQTGHAILSIDESEAAAPRLVHLRLEHGNKHLAIRIDGLAPVPSLPSQMWTPVEKDTYTLRKGDLKRWQKAITDRLDEELRKRIP